MTNRILYIFDALLIGLFILFLIVIKTPQEQLASKLSHSKSFIRMTAMFDSMANEVIWVRETPFDRRSRFRRKDFELVHYPKTLTEIKKSHSKANKAYQYFVAKNFGKEYVSLSKEIDKEIPQLKKIRKDKPKDFKIIFITALKQCYKAKHNLL